jgi:hypothetical protein
MDGAALGIAGADELLGILVRIVIPIGVILAFLLFAIKGIRDDIYRYQLSKAERGIVQPNADENILTAFFDSCITRRYIGNDKTISANALAAKQLVELRELMQVARADAWPPIFESIRTKALSIKERHSSLIACSESLDNKEAETITRAILASEQSLCSDISALLDAARPKIDADTMAFLLGKTFSPTPLPTSAQQAIKQIGTAVTEALALPAASLSSEQIFTLNEASRYIKDSVLAYSAVRDIDPIEAERVLGESLSNIKAGVLERRAAAGAGAMSAAKANAAFLRERFGSSNRENH